MNSKIVNIALSQIGVKEILGQKDNPEVLKYFNEIGYEGNKLKDETSWCSAFMNWVALKAGVNRSNELTARSWLNIGSSVAKPEMGDVVVFWRESPKSWKGHVGIFIRESDGFVWVLGGNQNNQVNISSYKSNRVLGYRKL